MVGRKKRRPRAEVRERDSSVSDYFNFLFSIFFVVLKKILEYN